MKSIVLSFSFVFACAIALAHDADTAKVILQGQDTSFQLESTEEPVYYADSAYHEQAGELDYGNNNNTVDPRTTQSARVYMNEDVNVEKFDDEKWKEIVGSATFEEKPPKREPKKEEQKPDKGSSFSFPSISPAILKAISFVVVFVLFAFILYYVSRNTTLSQSIRKMKVADVTAAVENIEELDTEGLLKQALASGDLRLAVRVHYLLLLKKLNEAGLIAWKKNKTNRDYLSELYGRNACYDDVRDLTLAYELVWYGERTVSSESFDRLSGSFESVNNQITRILPAV